MKIIHNIVGICLHTQDLKFVECGMFFKRDITLAKFKMVLSSKWSRTSGLQPEQWGFESLQHHKCGNSLKEKTLGLSPRIVGYKTYFPPFMPTWWNGRRAELRPRCPEGRESSNLSVGTITALFTGVKLLERYVVVVTNYEHNRQEVKRIISWWTTNILVGLIPTLVSHLYHSVSEMVEIVLERGIGLLT